MKFLDHSQTLRRAVSALLSKFGKAFLGLVVLSLGLLTSPLARVLHTENLLLVWAAAFLVSLRLVGGLSWKFGQARVLEFSPGGSEIEVARSEPGGVVGEMALITREPRMAPVEAICQVRTLYLEAKVFEGMLRERLEIGLTIMRELIARLKKCQISVVDSESARAAA